MSSRLGIKATLGPQTASTALWSAASMLLLLLPASLTGTMLVCCVCLVHSAHTQSPVISAAGSGMQAAWYLVSAQYAHKIRSAVLSFLQQSGLQH